MTASGATGVLAEPLRAAYWGIGVVGGHSDGQLIERIASGDGEAVEFSFHSLAERHGAMVLRVCQRVLQDPNDAEDAFQATFLILLRHADRIRDRGSVASWLHGVAARIAARAKVDAARRRRIERRGARPAVEWNSSTDRRDLDAAHSARAGPAAREISGPDCALLSRGPHPRRRRPSTRLAGRHGAGPARASARPVAVAFKPPRTLGVCRVVPSRSRCRIQPSARW